MNNLKIVKCFVWDNVWAQKLISNRSFHVNWTSFENWISFEETISDQHAIWREATTDFSKFHNLWIIKYIWPGRRTSQYKSGQKWINFGGPLECQVHFLNYSGPFDKVEFWDLLGFTNSVYESWIWIDQIVEFQKSFPMIPNSN